MRRLLIATLAVLALIPAAASAKTDVPSRVQVPAGHAPFLLAHAIGVQIYACSATADGPKWQFVAPEAVLFGKGILGHHYAGPTWQAADRSLVKAARVDGVTVDPTAIPWLLLKATTTTTASSAARRTSSALPRAAASSPPPRTATPAPSAASATSPTPPTTASGRSSHERHRDHRPDQDQARPAGHVGERRLRRRRRDDPARRRAARRQRQPGGRLVGARRRRRHGQRGDRRRPATAAW